jgi:hypothetical protein
MQKLAIAVFLTAFAAVSAFGQSSDFRKGEFFIGYSNQQVDTGIRSGDDFSSFIDDRETFHGFNVSGVYNVHRYVGIKGDISGAYNNTGYAFTVPDGPGSPGNVSFDAKSSLYNFLAGVQFKDNSSDARVKPFAHILGGAAHGRVKVENLTCSVPANCAGFGGTSSETGLAGAFGGGVDVRLSERVDLRLIQIDYNPIRFDNQTTHNVRFGIGFVFK